MSPGNSHITSPYGDSHRRQPDRWVISQEGSDFTDTAHVEVMRVSEHEAALAQERAKTQRWLDEDVKNMDAIERLESERDALEEMLEPFVKAKPMPGAESDHYVLHVSGDALRAARAALAPSSGDGQ